MPGSRSGDQLIYTRRTYTSNPTTVTEQLHRVNANGTNGVVLVDTNSAFSPFGIGWAID